MRCAPTVASSSKTSTNFCWGKGFAFNGGDANSNHGCCRHREREPLVNSSWSKNTRFVYLYIMIFSIIPSTDTKVEGEIDGTSFLSSNAFAVYLVRGKQLTWIPGSVSLLRVNAPQKDFWNPYDFWNIRNDYCTMLPFYLFSSKFEWCDLQPFIFAFDQDRFFKWAIWLSSVVAWIPYRIVDEKVSKDMTFSI